MTFAMGKLLCGAMLLTCFALWAVNIIHLHTLWVLNHRIDKLEELLTTKKNTREGEEAWQKKVISGVSASRTRWRS